MRVALSISISRVGTGLNLLRAQLCQSRSKIGYFKVNTEDVLIRTL